MDFSTYKHKDPKFKIKYPSNWKIVTAEEGFTLGFVSPYSHKGFSANINVAVKEYDYLMEDLDYYRDKFLDETREGIDKFALLETNKIQFLKSPAWELIYRGKKYKYNIKWLQIFTILGDKIYMVTYTNELNYFPDHVEEARIIADSMKLL